MTAMHPISPIIRTGAYSTLREAAVAALETARLGIVRGPVGIGKTFALRQITEELSQGHDSVLLFEAPSDKSKSIQRFYQKALFDLGFNGFGGCDVFEFFKGQMLCSYPFRRFGPRHRILLIVDECQRLAPNLLETLRHAYDQGQLARDGVSEAPAFGILLVGNHEFLAKGWRSYNGALHALLSRCAINLDLPYPEPSECQAIAQDLFPNDAALRSALAKHGAKRGSLREMVETHALALHYAGGGRISPIHLDKAMLSAGGMV